ncbi:MAG: hypothetical protein K2W79_06050 [Hydrotalea flava]|nr:hypothetical protein [Hydrotalea flava]
MGDVAGKEKATAFASRLDPLQNRILRLEENPKNIEALLIDTNNSERFVLSPRCFKYIAGKISSFASLLLASSASGFVSASTQARRAETYKLLIFVIIRSCLL